MNVQIINYLGQGAGGNYTYSKLSAPRSLDEFDLNIVDLSNTKLWYNDRDANIRINSINDFKSIYVMVKGSKHSKILFVFPQDIDFFFAVSHITDRNGTKPRYETKRLRDIMPDVEKSVFSILIPGYSSNTLVYENTITQYGKCHYNAAFFFSGEYNTIAQSEGSKKSTVIKQGESIYLTTLDIMKGEEELDSFILELLGLNKKEERPSWMDGFQFADDEAQNTIIELNKGIINEAEKKIQIAQEKLNENNIFKSILYTTGDELVEVVFKILEQLLSCDLSEFVDKKAEDFLIKKSAYTLIGEIKGVNSNIRNENIAQIELHFQRYKDKLEEHDEKEKIHQVLIMNTFRKTPLSERKKVNEEQIELAKRNRCLIIETITLLKLYEKFLAGEVDISFCENLLTTKTGLLTESDY